MPKTKRQAAVVTKVTAYLPTSVELSKRTSGNAMTVEVRSGDELLGTLYMGRGSVEWWPGGNKVKALRKDWREFATILDKHMQ
jgi:hypothetical protein